MVTWFDTLWDRIGWYRRASNHERSQALLEDLSIVWLYRLGWDGSLPLLRLLWGTFFERFSNFPGVRLNPAAAQGTIPCGTACISLGVASRFVVRWFLARLALSTGL